MPMFSLQGGPLGLLGASKPFGSSAGRPCLGLTYGWRTVWVGVQLQGPQLRTTPVGWKHFHLSVNSCPFCCIPGRRLNSGTLRMPSEKLKVCMLDSPRGVEERLRGLWKMPAPPPSCSWRVSASWPRKRDSRAQSEFLPGVQLCSCSEVAFCSPALLPPTQSGVRRGAGLGVGTQTCHPCSSWGCPQWSHA